MWIKDGKCFHLLAFAKRQEEEITKNPDGWFKREPLFCNQDVESLEMKIIEHDYNCPKTFGEEEDQEEDQKMKKERKADRNPPKGEKIIWKIGRFYGGERLEDKKYYLLMKLQRFWNDERTQKILIPMVTRQTLVTPCLLDYLCVNFSKNPEILYEWKIKGMTQYVNIFKKYNEALKTWHRGCFDPHRRVDPKKPDRIWFDLKINDQVFTHSTTVAQLNFFHWCWTYGILHYAEKNHFAIKQDHMKAQQSRKKRRLENGVQIDENGKKKQKREEIKPASKLACQTYVSETFINAFEDIDDYIDEDEMDDKNQQEVSQ